MVCGNLLLECGCVVRGSKCGNDFFDERDPEVSVIVDIILVEVMELRVM